MVIGSYVTDLVSRSSHLPKPGETLLGHSFRFGPGGKGSNQAVAAHRAGAEVFFCTKIGMDDFGSYALDFYKEEGMSVSHVYIDKTVPTGSALIIVDENSGQNMIVVTPGACNKLTAADIDAVTNEIAAYDCLLLQLEIPVEVVLRAAQIAKEKGKMVISNPAPAPSTPLPDALLSLIDFITPNETEAEAISGVKICTKADMNRAGQKFLERGAKNVLIALGEKGVYFQSQAENYCVPGLRVNTVDTTGAGDAFNGAFAAALAEKFPILEAIRFANVAGALSTKREGTAISMATQSEIDVYYKI